MNSDKKNNRAIVSIFMLFGFGTILITGLLSYGLRYNSVLSAVHIVFGLTFVIVGIFHLKNNLKPILNYFRQRRVKRYAWLSTTMVLVIVLGLIAGLPPFKSIVDLGYALKELKPIERRLNETIYTRYKRQGRDISIDIKAGEHYSGRGAVILGVTTTAVPHTTTAVPHTSTAVPHTSTAVPQMAVWIEDKQGNYLETLYVTKKASDSSYIQSLFGGNEVRRPEALPHWSYARSIQCDGLMMPSSAKPVADAITGATPVSSFELRTNTRASDYDVVVKFEVNRSFDFNQVYHKRAFPDDPIYSGTGSSAQPSLIYAATVDLKDDQPYYFMRLIGRGHHSGKDGEIYTDLAGITTAKEMVSRIIVEVL